MRDHRRRSRAIRDSRGSPPWIRHEAVCVATNEYASPPYLSPELSIAVNRELIGKTIIRDVYRAQRPLTIVENVSDEVLDAPEATTLRRKASIDKRQKRE